MKCSKCGTENEKGKSVCRKCGNFLYSSNPNNRVPLTKEQKRDRFKSLIKNSALGCFWSALIIIGMFIVLGLLSFLFVRFVLPDTAIDQMTETSITEAVEANESSD